MSDANAKEAKRAAADQTAVVEFLSNPESIARQGARDAGERFERHDTHGAIVFLHGDRAIKIKRAVSYDYMDFSTLEKRRAALERELEVNRINAPEIYLDVVPVTRTADGNLHLGGEGEPVEWALRMQRFPQSALLSHLIRDDLGPAMLKAVADEVLHSHARAAIAHPTSATAPLKALITQIDEAMAKSPIHGAGARSFTPPAEALLRRCAPVLERRAAAGKVRRCHGDLHLDNIVVLNGHPRLFDAIEFDEALATVDTLYDLAFLLMDLDARGARAGANIVLNRYLWRSQDPLDLEGLAALPLFVSLRAGVRAMVNGQRARLARGEAHEAALDEEGRYRLLAERSLEPPAPVLVAIGGLSGTGKSTLAAALAPEIASPAGALHLRSDLERKALHGADELTRLPESAYTKAESVRVYDHLMERARLAISAGHPTIVDAVFSTPEERQTIAAIAQAGGVPFVGIWLEAPTQQLVARVSARKGDASDATAQIVAQQVTRDTGPIGWHRLDAGRDPTVVRADALTLLSK